jgi:hypothetical protein
MSHERYFSERRLSNSLCLKAPDEMGPFWELILLPEELIIRIARS